MKNLPLLWLIEHVARELDVACAVRHLAKKRHGVDLEIRNVYYHAKELMQKADPQTVILPFFYTTTDLAYDDYIATWPEARYFNLSWEQIHYNAHVTIKAPSDDFARKKVIHHAWGDFGKSYLLSHGVPGEHIFLNGNPTYQLYRQPYASYFTGREELAKRYGLDPAKKWIFFPENYRWAFVTQSKIDRWISRGAEASQFLAMRKFCHDSLVLILQWCSELAEEGKVEVIFRPRPATNTAQIAAFAAEHVGPLSPRLRILKDESAREWILASDTVVSSFSTTMIEASIAGKEIAMVEPIALPEALDCDFYQYIPRLVRREEFLALGNSVTTGSSERLRAWATAQMLAYGDPIENLTAYICQLASGQPARRVSLLERLSPRPRPQRWIKDAATGKEKTYFNAATHENDIFDQELVDQKTARWAEILA